jgi:hypothetical protein
MLDVLKTQRDRWRKLCITFFSLFTLGRPVGWIHLLLAFRIFFLIFLPPPRRPLVYVLCTMGCAPFALFNII